MIPKMRHALYQDLGVRFPGVHVRTDSPTLEPDEYSILLNEVPIVRGKIIENALLTTENPETLRRYNIPFTTTKNNIGQPSVWVDTRYQEIMQKAGIKFWKPLDVMILHLSYFYDNMQRLYRHSRSPRYFRIHRKILSRPHQRSHAPCPLAKIDRDFQTTCPRTDFHQRSAHHSRGLSRMGPNRKRHRSPDRICPLLSQTIHQLQILSRTIDPFCLSSRSRNRRYGPRSDQANLCRLLPGFRSRFRAIDSSFDANDHRPRLLLEVSLPCLLTAIDVRRFVRKLIEGEFPDLSVVSYQEIVPEIRIQPLGRVQLS